MPLTIVRGPAGGGKSQVVAKRQQPGQVVVDLTRLHVALSGAERGPDGRYPVRTDGDPVLDLAIYVKAAATREAARRGMDGYVTTSNSEPEAVERLREQGVTGPVETVDPGEEVARRRLSVRGRLSAECSRALRRWYR